MPPARITVLGVTIDNITEPEALERIAGWVAGRQPHQVVTVNPEFVVEARHNAAFRRVLAAADMATPDGAGLLLAARLRATPLRGRVTGVALTRLLAGAASKHGWRIFFLGAAPSVAEQAAAVLAGEFPGLSVAGCYAGSPRAEDEAAIRTMVQAAKPDILLVAYGHPAQDLWIARNQPLLRVPVAIGVGGTFDEIAGRVPQAPAWMHRLGLKWLYRLITQPWRWRRIVNAVPVFLWLVLTEGRHTPGT
jgi:N-acetylglucosaminyldiphosphoundecaprenol N-acetyl-beta-D-mannosaminyltransferase